MCPSPSSGSSISFLYLSLSSFSSVFFFSGISSFWHFSILARVLFYLLSIPLYFYFLQLLCRTLHAILNSRSSNAPEKGNTRKKSKIKEAKIKVAINFSYFFLFSFTLQRVQFLQFLVSRGFCILILFYLYSYFSG